MAASDKPGTEAAPATAPPMPDKPVYADLAAEDKQK